MYKSVYIVLAVILMIGVIMTGCDAGQAKTGDTVQVDYTGTLADGTVFDSSKERGPLEFTIGSAQVIPGFNNAVIGMKVGEKKTVTIPADEAYGPHYDEMVIEVDREKLPSDVDPVVGMMLESTQKDGSKVVFVITDISDNNTVTLDANHPLAGKDLTFEIELLKIL